jgi:protein-arginine kinase activator protein McsA
MPKCENCGDDEETLHYTEWNDGTECGDLCEVCAEMFMNMENDDA